MRGTILGAVVLLALAGCGSPTKYQAEAWDGGFNETRLDKNVFKVSFQGNKYSKPERIEEMALLRSADVTLSNGFTHFVILSGKSKEDVHTFTTPVEVHTSSKKKKVADGSETRSVSYTTGGDTFVSVMPTTTNTIMVFKRKPDRPEMVYDARFLCGSLGRKYQVTCGRR